MDIQREKELASVPGIVLFGIRLWADHRLDMNRAFGIDFLMKRAAEITGKQFTPGDYPAAIKALDRHIADVVRNGR